MKHISILLWLLVICSLGSALSFGQNKINSSDENWSVLQTMHFDIYFPKGEDEFGKTAALMAEDIYYYIKAEFKVPILTRIPIIFYGTKSEFQSTNIIYPLLTEGVGGFTESLRNRVVVPFDGSYPALEELLAHELTHAYVNAIDSRFDSALVSLRPTAFPFWFSEGLPEYLSIGGEDDYNNMFLLDMVINDNLGDLNNTYGYLAYRLGESFLSYIADEWGKEKVPEFFFALRGRSNQNEATKKVFGVEFDELQERWKYYLKRKYLPIITKFNIPTQRFEQRTDHHKDGSYFNFAPRFSPDGSRYVYYSDAGARYSIWLAGTQGLSHPRQIMKGEKSAKTEEFYYFRSSLSWFPDNRRIAFTAKTADGDRIYIYDVDKEKYLETIAPEGLEAIYEVDVAPNGESLVIAAQMDMQADLFIYNLSSKELMRITNDSYNEAHPRFAPDSRHIAFDSEHQVQASTPRYGLFAGLSSDVFVMSLITNEIKQVTNEKYDCTKPVWADGGKKLCFVSTKHDISGLEIIDLTTGARAEVIGATSGIYAADVSAKDEYLLMANFFKGGWDLYFEDSPFTELKYEPGKALQFFSRSADLVDSIDLKRLDLYGKITRPERKRTNPNRHVDLRRPMFDTYQFTYEDSLQLFPDYAWDAKPDSVNNPPQIEPYRNKFALEYLWGGMAYSSSAGTIGNVELGLSDLMGNHGIGISLGVSGKLANSNLVLSYIYLKKRADYGFGIYNFYDESLYWAYDDNGDTEYLRQNDQQTGLYLLYSYPFSRFLRMEFDASLYQAKQSWDYLPAANVDEEEWIEDILPQTKDTVYAPGLSIVHDNTLSGSTGPLLGFRGIYHIRKSFAMEDMEYLTNYLDLRSYTLFSKRYSFAMRLNGAISTGKSPDRFSLGGYYGVRALDTNISGEKKVLASAELRFPFFENISLAFPIPLSLGGIRGSIFADAGSVWDDNEDFRGMRDGKLEDIKFGYGFGPRLNIGYFVLKLDIAWQSDLSRISKPLYYLSLTEDF